MTKNYSKILVCVDGSKKSFKALYHACDLAKNYDSALYIIYVVDKSIGFDFFDRGEYLKLLREHGQNILDKAEGITKHNRLKATLALKEGRVSNEILKYANKEHVNLIVVGSKGLGATLRFLLGSVSNKIANQAKCPVLIIK